MSDNLTTRITDRLAETLLSRSMDGIFGKLDNKPLPDLVMARCNTFLWYANAPPPHGGLA